MSMVTLQGGPHDGLTLDVEPVGKELHFPNYEDYAGRYVLQHVDGEVSYVWKENRVAMLLHRRTPA